MNAYAKVHLHVRSSCLSARDACRLREHVFEVEQSERAFDDGRATVYTEGMASPRDQAQAELALIPAGSRSQQAFRSAFFNFRENALGVSPAIDPTIQAAVAAATEVVRQSDLGFEPMLGDLLDRAPAHNAG